MTATSPETLAREYFGAVGAGDRARLGAVLSDDIVYRFPGRSSFAGTYEGRDAVLGYLDRLRELTAGTMNVAVQDVLIGSTRCAGWVRAEATLDGRTFGWNLVALIGCGEVAIESISIFYDDQYGVDEFLGTAS